MYLRPEVLEYFFTWRILVLVTFTISTVRDLNSQRGNVIIVNIFRNVSKPNLSTRRCFIGKLSFKIMRAQDFSHTLVIDKIGIFIIWKCSEETQAHQAGRGKKLFTIDKRWDLLGFEEYIPRVIKSHLSGKSTQGFLRKLTFRVRKSHFGENSALEWIFLQQSFILVTTTSIFCYLEFRTII